jgi:hypothetical protein
MNDIFYIGNVIRLTAEFENESGVATDPTTVILQIKKPDDVNEDNITPSNPAVGTYHYDYIPLTSGRYFYKFVGTGGIMAANEGSFLIKGSTV